MALPRSSGGFGGKLREARERKGVTLRQIANATKIPIGALEALERNDVSRLPGGIFSRAFVRSYALEVGLDPEQAIQEFVAKFPTDSAIAGRTRVDQIEDNEAVESDRRVASTVLRLLLVSVPVAGALLYFLTAGSRESTAPAPQAPAATAGTATPLPDKSPARPADTPLPEVTAPPPPPAAAAPAGDRLVVGLSATGRCWVSAMVDGKRAMYRDLSAGEQQSLEPAREVLLVIGDAGALNLVINGMPARPLGGSGQVVTIRLNADTLQKYLAAP